MEPETFERALHLWPLWRESLEQSREALGYVPNWPVEKAVEWINANYGEKIRPRAEAELRRLDLPENLFEYWEDCFYCDYRRPNGSTDFGKIRRRLAFEERDAQGGLTGNWVPGQRSLPPLPYTASITHLAEEDIQDPWQRVEIMVFAPLASRDLLESAIDQAWRTVRHVQRTPGYSRPHPLSALIVRAKANLSERKRSALDRFKRGETDLEGLLVEEWGQPDVQAELSRLAEQYGGNPVTLKEKHRELQKRVYDRVRRWFPEPKPRVKARGEWRTRL